MSELLQNIAGLVGAIAALLIILALRQVLGVDRLYKLQNELETKKELVRLAVLYAQQYWSQLDGPGRYQKAVQWLTEQARRLGVQMTEDEMRGLIEATVKEFKKEFGEAWYK